MKPAVTAPRSRWPRRTATFLALGLCFAVAATACQAKTARLPELGRLPDYQLRDQQGGAFGSQDLRGTPYLVAFMFTRCPTICPRVSAKLKEIETSTAGSAQPLRLVSISVDGEHDTPEVLSVYAKKHGLVGRRHVLLTGDSHFVAQVAEKNFKIAAEGRFDGSKDHMGISHGSHLVLVDKDGIIRAYYRSADADATAALLADLDRL